MPVKAFILVKIKASMRQRAILVAVCLLSAILRAADQPETVLSLQCGRSQSAACNPSPADMKKAKAAFSKALKLEKEEHLDEAYTEFDTAARLSPKNIDYITSLALVREQLIYDHIEKGNKYLLASKEIEAQAEFRSALNLDPQNEFAQERLNDSLQQWAPPAKSGVQIVEDSGEIQLQPSDTPHDFHFRGDSLALLTPVANAYGIKAEIDDSVVSRHLHFDLDSTDFFTAIRAACSVTGSFFVPTAAKQVYILKNTDDNHRQYDHLAMRTFRIPTLNAGDLNELTSAIRTMFDVRWLQQSAGIGEITVRAPIPILNAITKLLEHHGQARPQVMLDMQVFEVDHTLTRSLGMHIPNDFNLYNIPAEALAALGGQSIQSLINQLISSGAINQATAGGLAGLFAQLTGQQNNIFSQPLATFGGGLTLMGLSLDQLSATASLNTSSVKTLEHATMRGEQNSDTNFRIGSRYPILTASYAPVYNSPAIAQVLGNSSYQAPFPSFNYEDLGLIVKVRPTVYGSGDIALKLEIELRTLSSQSLNGVPIIGNRQYTGSITLTEGEPAVVAGAITNSEMRSLSGIPGLGAVPGLNQAMVMNTKSTENDEILIIITPHLLTPLANNESTEIWLPHP
jgi:general secretion pathway protein D